MTVAQPIVFATLAAACAIGFFVSRRRKGRQITQPASAKATAEQSETKRAVQPSRLPSQDVIKNDAQPREPVAVSVSADTSCAAGIAPEISPIVEPAAPTIASSAPQKGEAVGGKSEDQEPAKVPDAETKSPVTGENKSANQFAAIEPPTEAEKPAVLLVEKPEPVKTPDTEPVKRVAVSASADTPDSARIAPETSPIIELPVPAADISGPQGNEVPSDKNADSEPAKAANAETESPATAGTESEKQSPGTVTPPGIEKPAAELIEQAEPVNVPGTGPAEVTQQQSQEVAEETEGAHPGARDANANAAANGTGEPCSSDSEIEHLDAELPKRPQRYRPPAPAAPRTQKSKKPVQPPSPNNTAETLLEIRVRMTFDRFGFCCLALLPERKPDLDEEIIVKFRGESLALFAQEDWYQDLQFADIGSLLQDAIEFKGKLASRGRTVRWLLTARSLFVLASHPKASGFVQTTRLALGRTHVVLFAKAMQDQIEGILRQVGCNAYQLLNEAEAIPAGWAAFKNVIPTKSLALDAGGDPFYPIKPPPEVEIDLVSGICLQNAIWLAGYPPKIKLIGAADIPIKVIIDGKEAQTTAEGYLTAEGCDLPGQHSVHCEGLSRSRTYAIEEPSEDWSVWPAHILGGSEICGPLLLKSKTSVGRPVIVPMSTPLLLGSEPGQIFRCSHRNVSSWKGYVPFEVVWALPAHPLHSNKKTARILQFKDAPILVRKNRRDKATLDWCKAILDASRKGLKVDNSHGESAQWHQYKKEARKIWRAAK